MTWASMLLKYNDGTDEPGSRSNEILCFVVGLTHTTKSAALSQWHLNVS
jgi:hypothetical protein